MSFTGNQAAGAGMGLNIGGTLMSAVGAYRGAKADRQAAEFNARVMDNNAQYAQWRAEAAVVRGQKAAARVDLNTRQLAGRQRAMFAERGISVTEGAALDVLTDTGYMGGIDRAQALSNADLEAWALRSEGRNAMTQAAMFRSRARQSNPMMAAGATLLTGAGRVADRWYGVRQAGLDPFGAATPARSPRELRITNWDDF